MPVTYDFRIFTDRYHKNQHLPNDLIKMIMEINTKEIQTEIKNTHKMYHNQVMKEHHHYSGWLNMRIEDEDEEDEHENKDDYFSVQLSNLIEWDNEYGGGYEGDVDTGDTYEFSDNE